MIEDFRNKSNPGQCPIEGDTVSYTINGHTSDVKWDLKELIKLLKVSKPGHQISKVEFRRLFPQTAALAIDNVDTYPGLSDEQRTVIRSFNAEFSAAGESIDLKDPVISQAMDYFVLLGLLTEPEKVHILTGGF